MSAEDVVREALPKSIKSATRREELAGEIAEKLREAGHLYDDGWVTDVEVHGARVAVECVEAYGLVIELDANGNAVTVGSPWGFAVTA